MVQAETVLEMAERHVRKGRECIERQREIIKTFKLRGFPAVEAERLLANFEVSQAMHEAHLSRLQDLT